MSGLELRGVRRRFGATEALAGIDLQIRTGEFVALLGPSGCGKSTALNCIAGLLPLSAGSILLDGRRIDGLEPEKRGIGMVFQNYALFPHMSVARNVAFGLAMRGTRGAEADRLVGRALALVRLGDMADKMPGHMSGGQQQRVAIARAVVIAPNIVLMDEPLSNLDAGLRLEMRAEIRRVHEAIGSTTIYVTHDQDEALSIADRVVVMSAGLIRQSGTPEELYERPAHPDIAQFMGFRNQLPGRIVDTGHGPEIEVAGSRLKGVMPSGVRIGDRVVVSIRPEDLRVAAGLGGIAARVTDVEYRGRAFFGTAVTGDGDDLFFRSDHRIARGNLVQLVSDPHRALVHEVTTSEGGS